MAKRRFIRPVLCVATASLLLVLGLPGAHSTDVRAETITSAVDPDGAPSKPAKQISRQDRIPAYVGDEDEVEWSYDETPPLIDTTAELEAKAEPDLSEGAANLDVYSTSEDSGDHLAVVSIDPVNYENNKGNWVDLVTPVLQQSPSGWTSSANGISLAFPAKLSSTGPVNFSEGGGSLTIAPAEMTASTQGTLTGGTISYPQVFAGTDFNYTPTTSGYKEEVVLASSEAASGLVWDIQTQTFTLSQGAEGAIELRVGEDLITGFPLPWVTDSNPTEKLTTTGAYTLTDLGAGHYRLAVTLDPEFLASAVYPVTVDPGGDNTTIFPSKDQSVGNDNVVYDGTRLFVSNKTGDKRRSFLKFDVPTAQGRLVYSAQLAALALNPADCKGGAGNDFDINMARHVLDDWTPLNWNHPDTGLPEQDGNNGGNDWILWEIKDLYQHYVDTTPAVSWPNHGVAITGGPNTSLCTMYSSEEGGVARPRLWLYYNDLPNRPSYNDDQLAQMSLREGATVNTTSPTLFVDGRPAAEPIDRNDDDVMFQFQVSRDPDCAAGGSPDDDQACPWGKDADTGYTSPPTESNSWTIPQGVLTDGQTYYWRVIAVDVCGRDNGIQICSNKGGDQVEVPFSGTTPRSFLVSAIHLGSDPDWQMWSRDLGNGMNAKVNEATGNLVLDVPIETLGSPISPLAVDLSYNSHQSNNFGLGSGWDLSIGMQSSGYRMPIRLKRVDPVDGDGVKLTFRDGSVRFFSHRGFGHVFGGLGRDAGVVTESPDQNSPRWTYRNGEDGLFTFGVDGELLRATPRYSTADVNGNRSFTYGYSRFGYADYVNNPDGTKVPQLKTVTDPLGHTVSLTWAVPSGANKAAPSTITTWNNNAGANPAGNTYTLTSPGGRLTGISVPATPGSTLGGTLAFGYDGGGRVSQVANATQTLASGWQFTHQQSIGDTLGTWRIASVRPPGGGAPWIFNYVGSFFGQVASTTYVCEPRSGVGAPTSCIDSPNLPKFSTRFDFNAAALPLRVYGPNIQTLADGTGGYAPTTSMVWDSNNNLACSRGPSANAVALLDLLYVGDDPDTPTVEPDCHLDKRNTVHAYEDFPPYREKSVTFADPGTETGALTGTNATKSFEYDNDSTFAGLWAELFGNASMAGLPVVEGMSTTEAKDLSLNEGWGTGHPPGVNDPSFAVHWSGFLDLRGHADGIKYKFKVPPEEPASLTLDEQTLFSCAGEDRRNTALTYNCGDAGNVGHGRDFKTLRGDLIPIDLIYTHKSGWGNAGIDLKWDRGLGNDNWYALTPDDLRANLGLLTRTLENGAKETLYGYPTDDTKMRRLTDHVTVQKANGTDPRRTNFEDWDDYGNVTIQTVAPGTIDATSTASFASGGAYRPCQTQSVDPLAVEGSVRGLTVNTVCDEAGNPTKVTRVVPGITGSAQSETQNRVTTTTYDRGNRPIDVKTFDSDPATNANAVMLAEVTTAYDAAGRPTQVKTLLSKNGSTDPNKWTWATVDTAYAFTSIGPRISVTSNSPDQATGAADTGTVTVITQYDWYGNVISVTDPRDATKATCTMYDALSRPVLVVAGATLSTCTGGVTEPGPQETSLAISRTWYQLVDPTTQAFASKTVTSGADTVQTTTTLDMLGRKLKEQTGTRLPTSFEYDVFGNVTKVTKQTPTGPGSTPVATTNVYNIHGQVDSETKFAGVAGKEAITLYDYDAAGRLVEVDGPRAINDVMKYGYDKNGRLTSATYDGLFVPNPDGTASTTKASGSYEYDAAGERIRVTTPLTTATTMTRQWSYDAAGRQVSYVDGRGLTTKMTYDLGGRLVQMTNPSVTVATPTLSATAYPMLVYVYNRAGAQVSRYGASTTGTALDYRECFNYDKAGNQIKAFVVATRTTCAPGATPSDATKTVAMTYDSLNRLGAVTQNAKTTTYNYNATGQLTSVADPAGSTSFTYYPATSQSGGLVNTVKDPFTARDTTYSYDAAGRMTNRSDAAGLSWDLTYEPDTGRFDKVTIKRLFGGQPLASFDPTYDGAGNTTKMEQFIAKDSTYGATADSGIWDYTLDEANRMTKATQTGGPPGANTTFSYKYDGGGNRTSIQTNTAAPTTTLYDAAGLPTTETGTTTSTYQHDAVGNLVKRSTGATVNYTYSFDAWGRQTKAVVGANTMTYTVDPLGRAIKRVKGKTTTTYAFRGLTEQIAAATTGNSTTNYAYTASGSPLAQKTGTTTRFMLSNPHGDVVAMTDAPGPTASGVVKGSVGYSPYGERRNVLGESAALGYQGQLTDADTNLVDTKTRMYDPGMGRFISMDTLFGEVNAPMSLNQYVYGGLNPVTMSDPSGMCFQAGHAGHTVSSCGPGIGQGAGSDLATGGNPGSNPFYRPGVAVSVGADATIGASVSRPRFRVIDASSVSDPVLDTTTSFTMEAMASAGGADVPVSFSGGQVVLVIDGQAVPLTFASMMMMRGLAQSMPPNLRENIYWGTGETHDAIATGADGVRHVWTDGYTWRFPEGRNQISWGGELTSQLGPAAEGTWDTRVRYATDGVEVKYGKMSLSGEMLGSAVDIQLQVTVRGEISPFVACSGSIACIQGRELYALFANQPDI